MVSSAAATVQDYLNELPADRRETVEEVRDAIRKSLPQGYEETMQHGMISYVVPLAQYPDTYNGQALAVAALANQKNYVSLYLNAVYADPETRKRFEERWASTGKKLSLGKSCIRFRRADDLPLDVIGDTIRAMPVDRFTEVYETGRRAAKRRQAVPAEPFA
jgi:uncharacterized protein YdhG (YjbR/CyaY superfamily)